MISNGAFWTEPWFPGDTSYFNKNEYCFERHIVETYTEAHCDQLAIIIHKMTGFPLYAVISEKDIDKAQQKKKVDYSHMFVKVSDNPVNFLDINGIMSAKEVRYAGWQDYIDSPVVQDMTNSADIYIKPNTEHEHSRIAEELLKRFYEQMN